MEIDSSSLSRAGFAKSMDASVADVNSRDKTSSGTSPNPADNKAAPQLKSNNDGVSLKDSVDEINSMIQSQKRSLQFSVDDSADTPVISVLDSDTGKVIREIPSEEVRHLASRIKDLQDALGEATGVMLNKTA